MTVLYPRWTFATLVYPSLLPKRDNVAHESSGFQRRKLYIVFIQVFLLLSPFCQVFRVRRCRVLTYSIFQKSRESGACTFSGDEARSVLSSRIQGWSYRSSDRAEKGLRPTAYHLSRALIWTLVSQRTRGEKTGCHCYIDGFHGSYYSACRECFNSIDAHTCGFRFTYQDY